VPLDHGCRLDQHHGVENLWPNPVKPYPEEPVCGKQPKPTFMLPLQDGHLMSKGNELEFQGGAATKPESEYGNDGGKNRDHTRSGTAVAQKSPDLKPRLPKKSELRLRQRESSNFTSQDSSSRFSDWR